MYYSIRHLTKFLYKTPSAKASWRRACIRAPMPNQRCLTFHLSVSPRCRVFSYRDHLANHVHHFDIPGQHGQLVIVAESLVEMQPHHDGFPSPSAPAPGPSSTASSTRATSGRCSPQRVRPFTPELEDLGEAPRLRRRTIRSAPSTSSTSSSTILRLQAEVHQGRLPHRARALHQGRRLPGLLPHHDLARPLAARDSLPLRQRLPLPRRRPQGPLRELRHPRLGGGLSPELGWVGFDPTNNLVAGDRHIRTAIGRDYADVPPTHGISAAAPRASSASPSASSPAKAHPPRPRTARPRRLVHPRRKGPGPPRAAPTFGPVFRPTDAVLPEHCQSFAMEIEIHQREVRAQPVMVLGYASVSHLVEAEDALQDAEGMLHLRPHTGLAPVPLLL
jgi:transglutaminase-like putative cysteine protease